MSETPAIVSITYKPGDAAASEGGFVRIPLTEARLIEHYGIEGDTKGGNPTRNVNVMSAETLERLSGEGFTVTPGKMGEQIILRGLDVNTLPVGARIQLGDAACLEVTGPRTGCDRFEAHQGVDRKKAAGQMGVMTKVVTAGSISVGDPARVLESTTS